MYNSLLTNINKSSNIIIARLYYKGDNKMKNHNFKKVTKEILKNVAKGANINRKAQFVNAVWLLYVVGKR